MIARKTHTLLLKPLFWVALTFFMLLSACLLIFWPVNMDKNSGALFTIWLPVTVLWITATMIIAFISRLPGRLGPSVLKNFSDIEKSEKRNRAMVSALPDMVFIIDRQGRYIDCHISASQQSMVNPGHFLWKKVSDFLSESLAAETMTLIHKVIQTGNSFSHYYQLEIANEIRKYECRFVPHSKNDVMVLARDTTEMKNDEDKIRESESKYRTLVEQAADSIFISTMQGNFIIVNPAGCKLSQYTEAELLAMRFHDLVLAEDVKAQPFRLLEIASGKTVTTERRMKRKDGQMIDVEVTARMISPNRLLAFVRDITERKKIQHDLVTSRENLRQLTYYIEDLREAERFNIAREIHEDLGQQLAALKMRLSRLSKKTKETNLTINTDIEELVNSTTNMIETVRKISWELRPGMLDDIGLIGTMEWYCGYFTKRTGIRASFVSGFTDEKLPKELSIGLFRIFQESLINIAKHSEANDVKVSLKVRDQQLVLSFSDNGKGFDSSSSTYDNALGIRIMMERALKLKGSYTIHSSPGGGTQAELCVPLDYLD